MKRVGDAWGTIAGFGNLWKAAAKARRKKRLRASTVAFDVDLERELIRLEHELRTKTYRPGSYREFWISDPKPRKISAAPYPDRVVQHAVAALIEPVLERHLIFHTYACRPAKGTHRALLAASRHAASTRYVLKLDVRKYFPSIDHAILKSKLRRLFKDADLMWYLERAIDTGNSQEEVLDYFPGDDLFAPLIRRKGLPIGNLLSQHFANLYLAACDRFVTQTFRQRRYLRYMDDVLVFSEDKRRLADLRDQVGRCLATERLRLNEPKSVVYRCDRGVPFLGFLVSSTHRRLLPAGKRRAFQRLQTMRSEYEAGILGPAEVRQRLAAWFGHIEWGKTARMKRRYLRKAVFTRGLARGKARVGRRWERRDLADWGKRLCIRDRVATRNISAQK